MGVRIEIAVAVAVGVGVGGGVGGGVGARVGSGVELGFGGTGREAGVMRPEVYLELGDVVEALRVPHQMDELLVRTEDARHGADGRQHCRA